MYEMIVETKNPFQPLSSGPLEVEEVSGTDYIEAQRAHAASSGLKKDLGWFNLVCLGVGCTIGAGIFVLTGVCARDKTGPALFLSFIISGFVSLLSAFSYAEFAGLSPTAGSAYGFTRASLGPLFGWIVGWDLVLEYAVAAAGVAQGWSKYFNVLVELCGGKIPLAIRTTPWSYDPETGKAEITSAAFDFPAVCITITLTLLLIRGVKESARINNIFVFIKVGVVLFVIFAGLNYVKAENYFPFMPYGFFRLSFFGFTVIGQSDPGGNSVGVLAGSAIVFFAFVGFDAVTTNAEECINPQRDLPIGILGSLTISTILYVGLSLVLVGMVPYQEIDRESPISSAFGTVGVEWAEVMVTVGALAGLTSVLIVSLMGQPRILMAMARDGLLPSQVFTEIHPIYRTPYKITALTGLFVALLGSLIPLTVLVELVSMGTLLAFGLVNVSVIYLRYAHPEIPRPFLCPFFPFTPGLGALMCLLLMISLPSDNWIRLIVWFSLGMMVYDLYGRHNQSKVRGRSKESNLDRLEREGRPLTEKNDSEHSETE